MEKGNNGPLDPNDFKESLDERKKGKVKLVSDNVLNLNDRGLGKVRTSLTNFGAAVENLKKNMDYYLEYAEIQAKMYKKRYDSLVKEGFTKEQALFLCCKSDT